MMKVQNLLSGSLAIAAIAASNMACTAQADDEVDLADQPIVGGSEAEPGAWPGTVALYIGRQQACGGTLIADEWVLTAAHCVLRSGTPSGGFSKVVINRHRLTGSGGESIEVKRAVRHPGYDDDRLDNDIALLQLAKKSRSPVAKIVSANDVDALGEDTEVTVVGWGNTSETGSSSDVLQQVTVPVISQSKCKTYESYEDITSNMVCAGFPQGGKDSCQGDSGGPLFLKKGDSIAQHGIVSWGIGCAQPNAPGVYTRVGNYLGWIAETTGGAAGRR